MTDPLLRIGVLGAAQVTPLALLAPARELGTVRVVAVAAREHGRAVDYAREHGIDRAEASYEALLERRDVDAVYIPVPPSLHAEWVLRAVAAGKHVLVEKPLAANAADARRMVAAGLRAGRIVMEGLHYRYHPLAHRVRDVLGGGELGAVRRVEATLRNSVAAGGVRHMLGLAGGATMDLGCYSVHWARLAAGAEPTVVRAVAKEGPAGIDVAMEAELRFPGGAIGVVRCSMEADNAFEGTLRVECDRGELFVQNPLLPHYTHSLRITRAAGVETEVVAGKSTYLHQLEAFVRACETGTPPITSGMDSIANMRAIDAIYRASGLPLRESAMPLGSAGQLGDGA